MKNKNYMSALALTGMVASMAFAISPAFAETQTDNNQQWQGSMMRQNNDRENRGNMMRGFKGGENMRLGTIGVVTAINNTTITITGMPGRSQTANTAAQKITYTVNTSNATIDKNGVTSSIGSIVVGDIISVEGPVLNNTINATKIHDGFKQNTPKVNDIPQLPIIAGNGMPIVAGKVTLVNTNTITMTNSSSVSYTVDTTNAKIQKGNALSTVSNISVGDSIVVQGSINGSSVIAYSVIDQGINQSPSTNTNTDSVKAEKKGFFGKVGGFFGKMFGF